MPATAYW